MRAITYDTYAPEAVFPVIPGWDVAGEVVAWVAELLASPTWGVIRYAEKAARYAKSAAEFFKVDESSGC